MLDSRKRGRGVQYLVRFNGIEKWLSGSMMAHNKDLIEKYHAQQGGDGVAERRAQVWGGGGADDDEEDEPQSKMRRLADDDDEEEGEEEGMDLLPSAHATVGIWEN